jgi:outer membrane biosynthesis protein TonB
MRDTSRLADVRRSDLLLALGVATAVFAGSLAALQHARLAHQSQVAAIDPGVAIPIAVRPVVDLPAGDARAGRGDAEAIPRAWQRQVPVEPPPPSLLDAAWPASSEPNPLPNPAIAPTQPTKPTLDPTPADSPTPPDPEATDAPAPDPAEVEEPVEPESEGEALDQPPVADESSSAGESDREGDGVGPGEDGEGEFGAGGEGAADPLLARAIAFYRARLVAWFSARFRVSGSGLTPKELAKHRVRVKIEVGEDLRIVDYKILSSDHPAFEAAARSMLDKLRGETLPPPPENYPGAVQRQLTVTFTCAEDTCD